MANSCSSWILIILLCIMIAWLIYYVLQLYNTPSFTYPFSLSSSFPQQQLGGGEFPSFSYLYQDISDDNPASWSNRDNPFVYRDKFIDSESAKFVYQGSPNPLMNQMIPMEPADTNMFFFNNYDAKPECCPSPYSTSTGCVCIGAKPITTPQYENVTALPILVYP
jgi:hypothetical protein